MNKIFSLLCALPMLFFVSCQQGTLPTNGQVRRGPAPVDMVTCLRDVHPAYRSAFAGQNGANFDAQSQRAAYYAAMETARTPVPSAIAARGRSAKPATRVASKSRYAKSRSVASRSRSSASRSKSLASSRSKAARSKNKASSRKLAVNRSTSKRRR
ncbi:MAG: hypothetical protein MSQ05_04975 [Akkermansia sp.]|nr:hypothetical protein [Akkermansia sp.]